MFEAQQPVTLRTLNRIIAGVIRQQFGFQRYWVQAEVTSFAIRRGHCYLQLIEKEEYNDTICAEAKAIIWANSAGKILGKFQQETGIELRDQLQVLCLVEVSFHERFGFSLIIHELDPAFTLGKLEQARRKTIAQLKEEGVYDLNRQLPLPAVIQRLAVISSAGAKGYEDFMERLHNHSRGYRFQVELFPALVQGNQAPAEIIGCLKRIQQNENFDAVIIVRGGGSILDLECFNDYHLAREVALCTLPVITGIGHTTNRSICDEVAAADCITPTDVAYFLLHKMEVYEDECNNLAEGILAYTRVILDTEENDLQHKIFTLSRLAGKRRQEALDDLQEISFAMRQNVAALTGGSREWLNAVEMRIAHAIRQNGGYARHDLELIQQRLSAAVKQVIRINENDLLQTENKIRLTDPAEILRRGYSYTLVNGKPLLSAKTVQPGDMLTTVVQDGRIKSIINEN